MSSIPSRRRTARKICFVRRRRQRRRQGSQHLLHERDGSGRTKIADNGREPCWSPDGTKIAYMKGEFEKFTYSDAATKGLFIYDLKTGKTREHVNKKLKHLYTLNWSPDGKWFVATVHGGHGLSATRSSPSRPTATRSIDLKLDGCRPNISPDGKKVCWGHGDYCAGVAELDFSGTEPKAVNINERGREQEPDRDLSCHLVARHEIPDVHPRAEVQGQEPEGSAAGVPRRRGAGLERVRGGCEEEEPLGRDHQRRQIVQAAELGRWPQEGSK